MTSDRLTLTQIILLLAYALAMAGGQLLFKLAALRFASETETLRLSRVLQNGYFVAAIVLYATLAILWVWILTFTPLSRAYPFVALESLTERFLKPVSQVFMPRVFACRTTS